MRAFRRLIDAIEAEGSAALVTLARVEGSSPREAGARMVVQAFRRISRHDRRRGAGIRGARRGSGGAESRPRAGFPPLAGARARAWAMLRRAGRMAGRNIRRARPRRSFDLGDRRWRRLGDAQGAPGAGRQGRAGVESSRGRGAPIGRVSRATGDGSSRSGQARAQSTCSARGTSDGRSRSPSRRCRSRCAGSTRGATRSRRMRPPTWRWSSRPEPAAETRRRARWRAGHRHDPFPRARSRDRRRGAERRALRLRRV